MLRFLVSISFILLVVSGNAQIWKNAVRAVAVKAYMQSINSKQSYEPNKIIKERFEKLQNKEKMSRSDSIQRKKRLQKEMMNLKNSVQQQNVPKKKSSSVTTSIAPSQSKNQKDKVLNRFLSYVKIESQSVDVPDFNAFPMTEGQKKIAMFLADEIRSFGGKNVEVTVSKDYYVYVKIPSNLSASKNKTTPNLFFTAHLDVTPEAPGKGITPIVHSNYQGGDLILSPNIILSPSSPAGSRLNELKGKTIVTTDGTTLLGADDKAGCTILVTLIEELIKNPRIKHPDLYFMFSQNEDIGRAAYRYDAEVFGTRPDIVIDVDGGDPNVFSAENFTASGQTFYFKGNKAHPGDGLKSQYADALTAAAYFIGAIPPSVHPSASSGKQGYLHCYACEHPIDESGKVIEEDYIAKYRIRYFEQQEGDSLRAYLQNAYQKASKAFPFVTITPSEEVKQYDNIAYTMYKHTPEIIQQAALKEGIQISPKSERGGTTSSMLVTTGALPGGPCIYSGQQAAHSCLEWCCIEDLTLMVQVLKNIISETLKYEK